MPRDGAFERNRTIGLLAELCAVDSAPVEARGSYDDDHQLWRPTPNENVPPKGKEKEKDKEKDKDQDKMVKEQDKGPDIVPGRI
ncbi:MAG: hypothetical protein AB7O45_11060 [Alphaproteobacteria bacterium]